MDVRAASEQVALRQKRTLKGIARARAKTRQSVRSFEPEIAQGGWRHPRGEVGAPVRREHHRCERSSPRASLGRARRRLVDFTAKETALKRVWLRERRERSFEEREWGHRFEDLACAEQVCDENCHRVPAQAIGTQEPAALEPDLDEKNGDAEPRERGARLLDEARRTQDGGVPLDAVAVVRARWPSPSLVRLDAEVAPSRVEF
mmetsp:Transcript_17344/g.56766  ORF Transcript_17344/g.56766 Transcript_17344/m.56766 type:complete len:204 (-) Transcript_17344:648-1259(-)